MDNERMTFEDYEALRADTRNDWRREYFLGQFPDGPKQCMRRGARNAMINGSSRCINVAEFAVWKRDGQAQDVCRECLPYACEQDDEVGVRRLKKGT